MDRHEIEPDDRGKNRRQRRLNWEGEVTISSKNGFMPGRALDISESGIFAVLPVQLQVGEIVELKIKLPMTLATGSAVVRNCNLFRHGFEFLQPLHDVAGPKAADDDCQSCGGTGFIVQAVDGGRGVAFMLTRCSDCGGTGKRAT